jgi:hypothetical protein
MTFFYNVVFSPFDCNRRLLNLREQCLKEMGFTDIFKNIKDKENEMTIQLLPKMLEDLDKMSESEQIDMLIDNVLGGKNRSSMTFPHLARGLKLAGKFRKHV